MNIINLLVRNFVTMSKISHGPRKRTWNLIISTVGIRIPAIGSNGSRASGTFADDWLRESFWFLHPASSFLLGSGQQTEGGAYFLQSFLREHYFGIPPSTSMVFFFRPQSTAVRIVKPTSEEEVVKRPVWLMGAYQLPSFNWDRHFFLLRWRS